MGLALVLTAVSADVLVGGDVGAVFDVSFVLVCAALALLVRPGDFFTVGVLPPLLMLAVVALVATTRPLALDRVGRADDAWQAVVGGLATHGLALALGYALCLALLAVRERWLRGRPGRLSRGSGSRRPHPRAAPRVLPPTSR
nr:DUF6542 domain-containing protein [Nocardioides flavescens]